MKLIIQRGKSVGAGATKGIAFIKASELGINQYFALCHRALV